MTAYEEAFNIFASFPEGLTRFEFIELVDGVNAKRNSSAQLSQFVHEGLARKCGTKMNEATGCHSAVYVPSGVPFHKRVLENRHPARKRRGPHETELHELRKWKQDAIARYPDLAVDPATMAARKQVAGILRAEGCDAKAMMVERGDLDDGETMRVVRAMMERQQ